MTQFIKKENAKQTVAELCPIDKIHIGPRYRKDMGDINELAQSIKKLDLIHPVVINSKYELISGQRRLEAAKLLGWTEVPVRVLDLENMIRAEYDENVIRKDFLPSEAVAISKALRPIEKEKAKERELAGKPCVDSTPGKTRDKIAEKVGMGWQKLQKAEEVLDAAEAEPEKYQPLVDEMDRTRRVSGVHRKLVRMQKAEEIKKEPQPLPDGPFRTIVIDPPWTFGNTESISNRSIPYPTMTIEEITDIDIQEIAADDCILWLWTTNTHLPVAFNIIDTWDFEYKTMLIWVKDKIGLGYWLRSQTEPCLMATKGKPTVCLTNQSTVLKAEVREHSRKPDEFYEMVETLCPGSKVDLFAREEREGWITWGGEVGHENRYDK